MTNKEFAEKHKVFRDLCTKAGLPATARQASKYRRGKGMVYKTFVKRIS